MSPRGKQANGLLTQQKMLRAAVALFLEKGYGKTTTAEIAEAAGMAQSSFFRAFSSKEALFASIVEPHAKALMSRFMDAQLSFAKLPEKEKITHVGVESGSCLRWMVDYICEHREPVQLLICGADGTDYENFIHNMVEVEVESTMQYVETLRSLGYEGHELSHSLCHIIASGMLGGIFEIVIHDMPKEEAMRDVEQLREFYTAGWLKLFPI